MELSKKTRELIASLRDKARSLGSKEASAKSPGGRDLWGAQGDYQKAYTALIIHLAAMEAKIRAFDDATFKALVGADLRPTIKAAIAFAKCVGGPINIDWVDGIVFSVLADSDPEVIYQQTRLRIDEEEKTNGTT